MDFCLSLLMCFIVYMEPWTFVCLFLCGSLFTWNHGLLSVSSYVLHCLHGTMDFCLSLLMCFIVYMEPWTFVCLFLCASLFTWNHGLLFVSSYVLHCLHGIMDFCLSLLMCFIVYMEPWTFVFLMSITCVTSCLHYCFSNLYYILLISKCIGRWIFISTS